MDQYFEWRMFVEQTQMGVVLLTFLLGFAVLAFAALFEKFRELRRRHWRLLIRTSRYSDHYSEWISYSGEPGYPVLLKWKTTDETLTGGKWVFYKFLSDANFFDKLRAGKHV